MSSCRRRRLLGQRCHWTMKICGRSRIPALLCWTAQWAAVASWKLCAACSWKWVTSPAGGGPVPEGRPKHASIPMGLHYAGHKVARSAQVKMFALSCFMRLWHQKAPEMALNSDGYIPAGSWTWQELCQSASQLNFPKGQGDPGSPLAFPTTW